MKSDKKKPGKKSQKNISGKKSGKKESGKKKSGKNNLFTDMRRDLKTVGKYIKQGEHSKAACLFSITTGIFGNDVNRNRHLQSFEKEIVWCNKYKIKILKRNHYSIVDTSVTVSNVWFNIIMENRDYILKISSKRNSKIDAVLCVGEFKSVKSSDTLNSVLWLCLVDYFSFLTHRKKSMKRFLKKFGLIR